MSTYAIPPEICTLTGGYLSFTHPERYTFTVEEIATGLSRECRWGRQCRDFYSVAQHAVLVSMVVHPSLAFHALHHDDAEAYMGDMTTPLKQMLPLFKEVEHAVEAAIFEQFGIHPTEEQRRAVKIADRTVEATERRDLMVHLHDEEHSALVAGLKPLAMHIEPWDMRIARHRFIRRHRQLLGLSIDLNDEVTLARLSAAVSHRKVDHVAQTIRGIA